MVNEIEKRNSEYAYRGDYHIDLDPDWPYLPVYLEKMAVIRKFLDRCSPQDKILDAGCGEGVLVRDYRQHGLDIIGMDRNYGSEYVITGNILETGLPADHFDIVLCLDVIEHLHFPDQEKALEEFHRILKPSGQLMISMPNLAHLASRLSFLATGKLVRTSSIDRHPGDRPIGEYVKLLSRNFRIKQRTGIFPTFPLLSLLTLRMPSRVVGMHRLYNRLLAPPNWCFLNICLCEKVR